VLRLLTDDQKENRVEIRQEPLDNANGNKNLKNIITGDETWVYGYDVETKMQSSQWMGKGSARPNKARMSQSKIKVMLVVFSDWKGIVHHEFVTRGQMVNKQLYQEVLARLRDAVPGRGLNCAKTRLGCCTMTVRRLTRRSSFVVIWRNIRHRLCPIHPILRT